MDDTVAHRSGTDRAGVTGSDGASHNGMWDLSILQVVPRLRIAAPRDGARVRELLESAPGVTVIDDPANGGYPTALEMDGLDGVYVGRIRDDLGDDHGVALWIVADNLRKGAATNTVQIAELLTGVTAER